MSELKVEIVSIKEVLPHDNADRLAIAVIEGWACVVGKTQFKAGDKAIYIPVDSILSEKAENIIFADSKIQLNHHRVRTIRVRGKVSQGLLVDLSKFPKLAKASIGTDVAEVLGITKYEPPVPTYQQQVPGKRKKKLENPLFNKYTHLSNIKWYEESLNEGEQVAITEKIHGSNVRFGLLPTSANTFWKKILKFFKLLPDFEFVYGSHNVQLQNRSGYKGFYGEDVYGALAKKYDIASKLKPGEQIFGELYGSGIQKNYNYGCGQGEHKLVIFDVQVDGVWLDHEALVQWCQERALPMVPVLYVGPYSKDVLDKLTVGPSVLCPAQKVREGNVTRPVHERFAAPGRVVLKSINPDYYLDDENTDFH